MFLGTELSFCHSSATDMQHFSLANNWSKESSYVNVDNIKIFHDLKFIISIKKNKQINKMNIIKI